MLDPIVEEVHQARERLLEQFNGDLQALVDDVQKRQAASGRQVVSGTPRPPAVDASPAEKKAS